MNHHHLIGIKITSATIEELHNHILQSIKKNRPIHIASGNIHGFNIAYHNAKMRGFLNSSSIVRCDGYGIVLGAKLLGIKIAERLTWADWWKPFGKFCETHELSLFFLGSDKKTVESAKKNLELRYNRVQICGAQDGYFKKDNPGSEKMVGKINRVQPDILIVGMGMPLQETWLMRYRPKIRVPVIITGGACFDYLSGKLPRSPRWMSTHGLEWMFRLLIEPRRMFKRYIIGNPLFFYRLSKHHFGQIKKAWSRPPVESSH